MFCVFDLHFPQSDLQPRTHSKGGPSAAAFANFVIFGDFILKDFLI
jgi:hypothetical protein